MSVQVTLLDVVAATITITIWTKQQNPPELFGWPVVDNKARLERCFINGFLPREPSAHSDMTAIKSYKDSFIRSFARVSKKLTYNLVHVQLVFRAFHKSNQNSLWSTILGPL